MSGSLEGIGAVLREHDHYIEVVEIVPGGASWRQGEPRGRRPDPVASQQEGKDPVDVVDMRIDDVVKMIRGPKGTDASRLRVQKPTGAQETLAITRDVVVIEDTYARGAVLEPQGRAGRTATSTCRASTAAAAGQRTAAGDVAHAARAR